MTIALYDNIKSRYLQHKKSFPNSLLMIREGNTFTAYYKDAESIAKVFNTRPSYDQGRAELPINNDKMDFVLPRLVKAGYKIAIVETTQKYIDMAAAQKCDAPITNSIIKEEIK